MIPGHLLQSRRTPHLAAATRERDDRARLFPDRVRQGKMTVDDAQADYEAWCAIALWCEGRPIEFDCSFAQMELAAARAFQLAEEAVRRAKPEQADAWRARRDELADIYSIVSQHREWLAGINRRLRTLVHREAA